MNRGEQPMVRFQLCVVDSVVPCSSYGWNQLFPSKVCQKEILVMDVLTDMFRKHCQISNQMECQCWEMCD